MTYTDASPFVVKSEVRTDAPGEATQYLTATQIYNGLGQLVQSQGPSDSAGQVIVTNQRYNALGKVERSSVPTSVVGTLGTFLSAEWGALDTRPGTSTTYDVLARPLTVTNPDGTRLVSGYTVSRTFMLDANGHQKASESDALGRVVRVYEYDGSYGSAINYSAAPYAAPRYGYDVQGNLRAVTDTLGNTTVITFDYLGRKVGMKDPDMGVWAYAYDAAGNLTSQTDAKGQTITFAYDALGRVSSKQHPVNSGQSPVTYTYDVGANGKGNRTRLDDGSGSTTWAYDARGRVITEGKTIAGVGTFTTSTSYDAADRVRALTYPTGEVITHAYGARGALENLRSQTYGTWVAANLDYNANGSLSRLDLGNGLSTLYGYFGIGSTAWGANSWDSPPATGLTAYGRLWRIRTEAPSGAAVQDLRYAYDAAGNVAAFRDLPRAITGTLNLTFSDPFDSAGANWSAAAGVTLPFNDAGNNTARLVGNGVDYSVALTRSGFTLASGGGMQVRFKVDNAQNAFSLGVTANSGAYQRLAVVGEGSGRLAMQYYDGVGKRYPVLLTPTLQADTWYTLTIALDDARGHTLDVYTSTTGVHYAYNVYADLGQAWRFLATSKSGALYLDDYREFNGGAVVVPDNRQAFTYDALDRLTQASRSTTEGYTGTYAYDAIGNLTGKDEGSGSVAYAYGDGAHKHAVTALGGNAYSYDANGNMTVRTESGATYTQTWDVDNRLAQVVSGTLTTQFGYDADGRRVLQTLPDGTKVVYVGGIEVSITGTARITKTYYAAGAKLVAMRVITASGSALYFLHSDHLGSVSLTTDGAGAVVSEQKYTAWGVVRAATGASQTDIGYTGQYADSTTGLMFYQARYYSASVGRFVSADSIVPGAGNPQALNRYSYVYNSPLKYTDPSGHDPIDDDWRKWFETNFGRFPDAGDELLYLFSLAYPDEVSWLSFYNADGTRNAATITEVFRRQNGRGGNRSWDTMPAALVRLSRYYRASEKEQFVRDVGLLYAGLRARSEDPGHWDAHWWQGEIHQNAFQGPGSIDRTLIENTPGTYDEDANVHHWAWAFAMGYDRGEQFATAMNVAHETREGHLDGLSWRLNESDLEIGSRGAQMGGAFRSPGVGFADLPGLFARWLGIGPR